MRACLKYFFITVLLVSPVFVTVAQLNSEAPEISNVNITEVDEHSATIQWETDVNTDATINYGLNEQHGLMRYPYFDRKKHNLKIDQLEPATTYYFRVVSSDEFGNKGSSAGFVFTTTGTSGTSNKEEEKKGEQTSGGTVPAGEQGAVEEIGALLSQISSSEGILAVKKEVEKRIGEILAPPIIVGVPKVITETDYAEVSWVTNRKTNSMVSFSPENEYSGGSYSFTQGNSSELTIEHMVKIVGLEPSTTYHFKVFSEDELGMTAESEDGVFVTKSILPKIRNIKILKIQETSATIAWNNDVPADGLVEYTNLGTGVTKSAGDPTFTTSHSVQLENLQFGARYSAIIKSTNESGDEIVSEPFTFVTVRDEVAPIISKVTNESTLFPGDEVKIQTIIAWETDEVALCQFFYSQGLAGADNDNEASMDKEINPVLEHVQVIVGLSPATVYRFWMECDDIAGNNTKSEDFVLFTPQKEKSIIDIIIENFQGTFGWVKNITG